MQRNHSLDFLRCIFAFMVVYLHTHYWTGYPMDLCRCAVPGFMAMTGYFIYSVDYKEQQQKVLKSAKHHLIIYAWSLSLYIFLTIRFWINNQDFSALSLDSLVSFLFYAELDFLYFGFHLWYLHAVIYALLILWIFSKLNCLKWLVWFSPFFVVANLEVVKNCLGSLGSYHLPTYISYGVPYLAIGMAIKRNENSLRKFPIYFFPALILCFLILLYIEGHTLADMGIIPNDKYITMLFLVPLLLIMCIIFPMDKEGVVAKIGRKYSLDIYVFHNFTLFLYYSTQDKLPLFINDFAFKYTSPLLIFFATLLFSFAFRHFIKSLKAIISAYAKSKNFNHHSNL